MSIYFQDSYFDDQKWKLIGSIVPANPIVHALYPMDVLTQFHQNSHIKGLTGRWMDTLPGRFVPGGNFHRIRHGHHALYDGMMVWKEPKLKFGEFLHHLGMDSLSKQGVPNPFLPTETLFKILRGMGLSVNSANELLTVNLPKLLGGGVSLLCAGTDVYACFADTIPHTWAAATWHLGLGAMDLFWGCFPPNPLILLSSGMELGVGITTGARTLIDIYQPATMSILDSAVVGFPMWGEMVTLSALFGAGIGYWSGNSWENISKGAGITVVSSATAASISGMLTGNFVAPFAGAAAGFVTGLLLRKIFMSMSEPKLTEIKTDVDYFGELSYFSNKSQYFNSGVVIPLWQLPREPIGTIKDGRLLLDIKAVTDRFTESRL